VREAHEARARPLPVRGLWLPGLVLPVGGGAKPPVPSRGTHRVVCRWCGRPVRMVDGGWGSPESPMRAPILECAASFTKLHTICPPAVALTEILNVYRSL
jgi:hypothetical protein